MFNVNALKNYTPIKLNSFLPNRYVMVRVSSLCNLMVLAGIFRSFRNIEEIISELELEIAQKNINLRSKSAGKPIYFIIFVINFRKRSTVLFQLFEKDFWMSKILAVFRLKLEFVFGLQKTVQIDRKDVYCNRQTYNILTSVIEWLNPFDPQCRLVCTKKCVSSVNSNTSAFSSLSHAHKNNTTIHLS